MPGLIAAIGANAFVRAAASTVATLVLTANGSNAIGWASEGTPDYTLLTSKDGATSKIYSPTSGDLVTYVLSDLPGGAATVTQVKVTTSVFKLDPVTATTRCVLWIGGVAYESPDQSPAGNTVYEDLSYTWTTNPATGAAWTVAAVNAMEIGIRKSNAAGERCSYISADVTYS